MAPPQPVPPVFHHHYSHFRPPLSISQPLTLLLLLLHSPSSISSPPPHYQMGLSMVGMGGSVMLVLVAQLLMAGLVGVCEGQGLVPGVVIFGDSVVDVGNNNNRLTLVKANFPPYGRDFVDHAPTGRFCNGKLATDFTVENLGFTSYPPAYLSEQATGKNLLSGANFASGGAGYLDSTSTLYGAISLNQQLRNYKDYQSKVERIAGKANATALFAGSIYVVSAGASDYVQNYYINPVLNRAYTPDQFADLVLQNFNTFSEALYNLGARRIGVTSLPPLGCLPAVITLFGAGRNDCIARLNNDAIVFNKKLKAAGQALKRSHPKLKLVVFDIYNPLLDLIAHPENYGFFEARKACCGTGTIETSLLCNTRSPGTCANATGYVFWDSAHPTEAANQVLSDAILAQGIDLIS
ncbi:GDSL esterase/lipase At5g03810-like [Phoenix dactylifera]|uniref:GDSL esterase/lipase At5g03810-like n=1 Tax=Phoenix dactylifera TaxID=42345 RepID=A0A8B7C8N1_PHODC|nr:GDSL esterase/lipase At5g03810-like [Phoenix dactylifera]